MPKPIIIFCEQSGAIRRAMRARGIEAFSNDILPSADNSTFHIQDDARELLKRPHLWSAFVAHPECRYLSVSGMHWNSRGAMVDGCPRSELTAEALEFAGLFFASEIEIRVIENPVSILSTRYGKAEQYVQPYELGDDASKKTCFWIKGTKRRLIIDPAKRSPGRWVECNGKMVERWSNQTDSGQNRLGPSEERSAQRAETYPGIANAVAELFVG